MTTEITAMGILNFLKRKKKQEDETVTSVKPNKRDETPLGQVQFISDDELSVVWEQLPDTYDIEKYELSEIDDKQIISRLNSLVPAMSMTGVSVLNIIKNVKGASGETLTKVLSDRGTFFADPKTGKGARRVFIKGPKSGIKESAKAIGQGKNLTAIAAVTNAVNVTISVASMIVGQYYMDQIDKRLRNISDKVSKLIEYFDSEYHSRVASLIESVYNISKFKMSSIENEELRNRELDKLQNLRMECQTLLILSENQLLSLSSKNHKIYSEYQESTKEIEKWLQYERVLLQVLHQINALDFTLHLGVKSLEQCFGSFPLHEEKYKTMREQLLQWHNGEFETFRIDLAQGRRKRRGVLGLLVKTVSFINDDWNYISIPTETVEMIVSQMAQPDAAISQEENLFERDVQIFAKNGRYFYLPDGAKKQEEVSEILDPEGEISETAVTVSQVTETQE